MAVKLHRSAFDFCKRLVREGKYVADERDDWSEHQPSTKQENEFIEENGLAEYGKWHLGIDDAEPANRKVHYKFPVGDFRKVHRCAAITAESRAGQYKYMDIEKAAHQLHEMMDSLRKAA